jgi:hypothetical protein
VVLEKVRHLPQVAQDGHLQNAHEDPGALAQKGRWGGACGTRIVSFTSPTLWLQGHEDMATPVVQ